MTHKFINALRTYGVVGIASLLYSRFTGVRIRDFDLLKNYFSDRSGLEIGGPSAIFRSRNLVPVYPLISQLDGCNFAEKTTWSENSSLYSFQQDKKPGAQFINDATELKDIGNERYDFILASHVIEHVANPIKAIQEWRRVVKENGLLLLVIPHKEGTFDHARPVTEFNHLVIDFENNIQESDKTHVDEILKLHDLALDPLAGSFEDFKERSKHNLANRTLHHHVFDTALAIRLMDYCKLKVLFADQALPYHIILAAIKTSKDVQIDNAIFLSGNAAFRKTSPFKSDKSF